MANPQRSKSVPACMLRADLRWEPEDPACTTNVDDLPPASAKGGLSGTGFLDVHNLYWQPPSEEEKQQVDGLPKGFLSFLEPEVDGSPKGFLQLIDDGVSTFLPDGKPKGFLEFVAGEDVNFVSSQHGKRRSQVSRLWRRRSLISVGRRLLASDPGEGEGRRKSRTKRPHPQRAMPDLVLMGLPYLVLDRSASEAEVPMKREDMHAGSPPLPRTRRSFMESKKRVQSTPTTPRSQSIDEDPFSGQFNETLHWRQDPTSPGMLSEADQAVKTSYLDDDPLSLLIEESLQEQLEGGDSRSPRASPPGKNRKHSAQLLVDEEDVRLASESSSTPVFEGMDFEFDDESVRESTSMPEVAKVGYDTSIQPALGSDSKQRAKAAPPAAPTRMPSAGVPGRDWNEQFQSLLADVYESRASSTAKLRALCEDFASVAKRIGTIIISELFLGNSERTIPSVTRGLGGVAGGEKYVYLPEGMFFKFAVDDHNLYNGDEGIMKAAGQELRSLLELMDCRVSRLHFPLMVLVDYRGYRLIAMPLLPVGHDTIVYGSADGGNTIHTKLPEVNARMQLVARRLNLAGHTVASNRDASKKATVYAPVDLEVHLGKDGRFYVLDIARLFPAATPVAGLKGCQLYRLLRPELVRGNPKPLCSDAFSRWNIEGLEAFNRDAEEATLRMRTVVVADFARWLDKEYGEVDFDVMEPERMIEEFLRVTSSMHRRGINLRLLGAVRQCTSNERIRRFLFTQAVARTAKQILWGRMRNLHSSSEMDYRELVLSYSNLLFGRTRKSAQYWSSGMKNSLLKRFSAALTPEERQRSCDMRSLLYLLPLFHYFPRICGFSLDAAAVTDFLLETEELLGLEGKVPVEEGEAGNPLAPSMLLGLVARVKTIHHIDFAEGTLLSQQATAATEGADALFQLADERFRATLERKPDDCRALHNWGLSLSHRAKRAASFNEAETLYRRAERKFAASLVIDPKDWFANYLWANMLSSRALRQAERAPAVALFQQACARYETADRLQPGQFDVLFNWANAAMYVAGFEQDDCGGARQLRAACALYARAVQSGDARAPKGLRNWGVALSRLARLEEAAEAAALLFDEAEEKLRQSLDRAEPASNSEVYFNWGNLHYHRAQLLLHRADEEAAARQLLQAGEKYVAALENGGTFTSSLLINWGKSLNLLAFLDQLPDGVRLLDAVDMYLGVVVAMLFTEMGRPSLKPVVALGCCGRPGIVRRVVATLRRIAKAAGGKALYEAGQGLEVIELVLGQAGSSLAATCPEGAAQPPISPSVAVFLTKMKLPQGDAGAQGGLASRMPSLRDFEKLSSFMVYGNCLECTVALKTTATLYSMKMVKRSKYEAAASARQPEAADDSFASGASGLADLPAASDLAAADPRGLDEAGNLVALATAGGLPFLVRDVYIYRRRKALYFIQELVPAELLLCRIRQAAEAYNSRLRTVKSPWALRAPDRRLSDPHHHVQLPAPGSSHHPSSLRRSASDFLPREAAPGASSAYARCLLTEEAARFFAAEIVVAFTTLHRLGFVYG